MTEGGAGRGGGQTGGEGGEGGKEGWGRRKFYLGVELSKCIDPYEGEALRRGSTFKPGGCAPLPPCSAAYGGGAGGREGGKEEGGRI